MTHFNAINNNATKQSQLTNTAKSISQILGSGLLILGLTACGSDGGSSSEDSPVVTPEPTPEASNATFSESSIWEVDGAVTEACYDIDTQKQLACTSDTWDIKFENKNRSVSLWTNSGISGDGKGAAFYTMPWSELAALKNAQEVPEVGFKPDGGSGVFNINPWYEYNLNGQHKLAPNNRVYLVTTDASDASTTSVVNKPVYALQLTNYYDEAGHSGHPTIRWIDTALPNQVQTKTVDASSSDDWVYLNLATGKTTTKDGDWQVGLKRYDVILNSGASGSGKVGGYVAKTPAGYYDANGKVIKSKFMLDNTAESLTDLTTVSAYDISADGVPWIKDESSSQLNPDATGTYPVIDYGWFVYKGNEGHRLFAKPEGERIGGLIRSAEGDSYARFYLDNIAYEGNSPAPSKWTFKFDIQPSKVTPN